MSSVSSSSGSGVVSVASSSSAGAAGGSVIDVSSLVSELVQAEQVPQQDLINNQMASVTSQISSLGQLQSALSTFQSSLSSIDSPSNFNTQTANTSNSAVFSATAASNAAAGTYSMTVSQLAQAEQVLSSPLTTASDGTLGTGVLTLSLGSSNFTVNVSASNNTPTELAAAINSASGNPGITATVIQGTNGSQLLLSSNETGAANTIQVSVNETDGGSTLSALAYSSSDTSNYTVQTTPQDAEFSIAGVAATSASNTVTSALSGVTLTLSGTTTTDDPATLTVSTDTSTVESNIESFVDAYNTLVGVFTSLGGFDSETSTAGTMMGNPLLMGMQNEMNNALNKLINTGDSTYNSLPSIGITTSSDGTLSINGTTLSNALSTNFSAVSQIFSGSSGVASVINTDITNALASNGMFSSQSQNLTSQENALTTQTNTLQTQMTALSASLTQQYSSLNTLLSSLQSTSSYLTQAFATLPSMNDYSSSG